MQAQKEITAHNMQLREQTKQLERDMVELRDQSLVLVSCRNARLPREVKSCGCYIHAHVYVLVKGSV